MDWRAKMPFYQHKKLLRSSTSTLTPNQTTHPYSPSKVTPKSKFAKRLNRNSSSNPLATIGEVRNTNTKSWITLHTLRPQLSHYHQSIPTLISVQKHIWSSVSTRMVVCSPSKTHQTSYTHMKSSKLIVSKPTTNFFYTSFERLPSSELSKVASRRGE